MIITHKKAAEILKHWRLENESVTDIYYAVTGEKNDSACYVGDRYVLKFTANLGKLKNNTELAKALENVGLCAAVPIPTCTGESHVRDGEVYFYLTRRLPGSQTVSEDFFTADGCGKARFTGEILGQLHLALQGIDVPVNDTDMLNSLAQWALPKTAAILNLNKDFCDRLLAVFGTLYPRLPRQIIHRDPNPGNIIRAEDTWGFIDFELSERNARIYDPCYAATAILSEVFSRENSEHTEKWLAIYKNMICGYDDTVHLTDDERTAIPCMILANQMICTAWFSEQEKYPEQFDANRRMTLWLIEHFDALRIDN